MLAIFCLSQAHPCGVVPSQEASGCCESFVTSAYRKKMEEIAKQEEEEARKERIEAALDVTKQGNMDGFYRHLYRQTMGEEKEQVEGIRSGPSAQA